MFQKTQPWYIQSVFVVRKLLRRVSHGKTLTRQIFNGPCEYPITLTLVFIMPSAKLGNHS